MNRLEFIQNILNEYSEIKYIITNQFLAGDLIHIHINDKNDINSFSLQPIGNGTQKLYGVYEQTINDVVIIFDLSLKYPSHREYNFYNDKFELIFKTNVDNFDSFDKNETRFQKLKEILENG